MLAFSWCLPDMFLLSACVLVTRLSAQSNCFEKEMFLFTEKRFRSQLNTIETIFIVLLWTAQVLLFIPIGSFRLLYWITFEQVFIGSMSLYVNLHMLSIWVAVRCFKRPRSFFPQSTLSKKMLVIMAICVFGRGTRFVDCFGVSTIWTHFHEDLATTGNHWAYTMILFVLAEVVPEVVILITITRLNFLDDHQKSYNIHALRERLRKLSPQKYVEPDYLTIKKTVLGRGALATVFEGVLYDTKVAVKVFDESLMKDPDVVLSTVKEIRLLCLLRHPLVTDLQV